MKKVQVLLSTYNGERFLEEQLQSLAAQKGVELSVLVRDDGSSDSTTKILNKWQKKGLLRWYQGENIGPAKSFLHLMKHAANADYYAFCDQDDVWLDCKLQKAAEKLDVFEAEKPAMYFSKTQLVDAELEPIQCKISPEKAYTLGQALIRNNATGCTVVFNRKLLQIINSYEPNYVAMHDWWIYLVCLLFEGNVTYDPNSYIKYRQHGRNVVGGKASWLKIYKAKLRMMWNKEQSRKKIALGLLKGYSNILPIKSKDILLKVSRYDRSLYDRMALLLDPDIKNSSMIYNIYLIIAVMFNAF